MATRIKWKRSPDILAKGIREYGEKAVVAAHAVAGRNASVMEARAKASAPWQDRTGNARSGLFGIAERIPGAIVIYLSHGVLIDYGLDLELARGGRYSIIMKVMEAQYPQLMDDLKAIFR